MASLDDISGRADTVRAREVPKYFCGIYQASREAVVTVPQNLSELLYNFAEKPILCRLRHLV